MLFMLLSSKKESLSICLSADDLLFLASSLLFCLKSINSISSETFTASSSDKLLLSQSTPLSFRNFTTASRVFRLLFMIRSSTSEKILLRTAAFVCSFSSFFVESTMFLISIVL